MRGLGYKFFLVNGFFLLFFLSCKKEMLPISEGNERAADQQLKDSIFHYYKLYSLWSDNIMPEDKALFSFTDSYASPVDLLTALKRTTPFHAGYNASIDRFSYLEDMSKIGSSPDDIEVNRGFGLFVSLGAVNENFAYPIIYYAEGGSSAAQSGIRRSDVILGIDDDQDFSVPVSCESGSCKFTDEKIRQAVVNKLLAAMQQSSMRIKVRHTDGNESTKSISSTPYEVNPIIKNKVFLYPAKAIGYLALSSFEAVPEGKANRSRLNQVFDDFEQNQIRDLIFDLRYNTGGHVSTVEYMANKIIGATADRALMYKYILNTYLSQPDNLPGESFDDVNFQRRNNLNLSTVYFLVTDVTASASELLINVLRPYMNVVIIAEHNGTYGKPVGFFRQEIMGKKGLWVASFKLTNARNQTDYWDGIGGDQRNVRDYIFRDFGDAEEDMLSAALNHSLGKAGSSARASARSDRGQAEKMTRIENVNIVSQGYMRR